MSRGTGYVFLMEVWSLDEVEEYVRHRLAKIGGKCEPS